MLYSNPETSSDGRIAVSQGFLLAVAVFSAAGMGAAGSASAVFTLDPGEYGIQSFPEGDLPWCLRGVAGFEPDLPNLPLVTFCFVIPQGASVTGAAVSVVREARLGEGHPVLPVRVSPLSQDPPPYLRNPWVYSSENSFPADRLIRCSTGSRTGFNLAEVTFSPFSWNPLSGGLRVAEEALVEVRYESNPSVEILSLTGEQIAGAREVLESVLVNPGDLAAFAPAVRAGNDQWPVWVAVGPEAMEPVLQPLVDFRNASGLASEYIALEWIYQNYGGWDTQEQIRNYLKDSFENRGLQYALLIGDWGPTQRISSLRVGSDSLLLGETTDLYYSDLTRMWDGDGDHQYGENTDWIDYYSDISVGRFSSDNPNHIQTMVEKTVSYETLSDPGQWRSTALLCGAGLWPDVEPDGYWGSFVCDSISGRIPGNWTQHKLYEYWDGHPVNQIEMVNQGASYVSDQGHGGSGGVYWLYSPGNMFTNQNYTGMTNLNRLAIFHSMACSPGQLSAVGCSAERLLLWPDGGAVGVMYNSNYGWGTPPAMGPSEHLELHFAEMLFLQQIPRIGDMQAGAKDAFKAAGGMTLQNWVLQENNLLGDPAAVFIASQTGITEGTGPQPVGLGTPSPNPSAGVFQVPWNLGAPDGFTLTLFDLAGRQVWNADCAASGTCGTASVNAPWLPPGCYLLRIACGDRSASVMTVVLGNR
jgi:hypothetical protein